MSILENIDNPDWLQSILGSMGPSSANASPAPPPPPPQSVMAQTPPSFSGNAPDPGASSLASQPITPIPPAALQNLKSAMTSYGPGDPNGAPADMKRAVDVSNAVPRGSPVGPLAAAPAPRPQMDPSTAPPAPPATDIGAALGLPPGYGGGNQQYLRSMVDKMMSPEGRRADMIRTGLASLGKGLSAVGQMRPGASGATAFAAGAGGALEGGEAAHDKQFTQKRQALNELFNQSSTAFKDMLAADTADDRHAYTQAQMEYLHARAGLLAAGGRGTNAYQNTPEGRFSVAEQRIQAFEGQRRKSIDALVRSGVLMPDEAEKRYKELDQQVDQYRNNVYRGMKITPEQAQDIKSKGTQKNPFDARTMSEEEFNLRVPMGGFYTDHKGKLRQRVQPPPGSENAPAAKPNTFASDQYGTALDDQTAMTPQS